MAKRRRVKPEDTGKALPSEAAPDGLLSCCLQEPPTLWGLLLLFVTVTTAWTVRREEGVLPVLSGMGLVTLALLGVGYWRGRRAWRVGRGEAVVAETTPARDADLLFDAGPQARKVRFLMVVAFACAVGASVWGLDLARTWGVEAADGGVLKPLWARLLFGGSLAAAGIAFALSMIVYGTRYVTTLRKAGADGLELSTLLGRRRTLARADLGLGPFHHGRAWTIDRIWYLPITAISVAAPWRTVYVLGERGPFILDLQGAVSEDLFTS
jgi:hypothetical protein